MWRATVMTDLDGHTLTDIQNQAAVVAAQVVEEEEREQEITSPIMTTSSGVVIQVQRVPTRLMSAIYLKYPLPEPPKIPIVEGSKTRYEKNFDDPGYLLGRQGRMAVLAETIGRLYLLRGMKIIKLPEGMPTFEEDTTWEEELDAIGLGLNEGMSRTERYLHWLELRVCPGVEDTMQMQRVANFLEGVTQEGVDQAMALFRD